MPLTDAAIRSLTPGDKPIKVADEKGLFLLVSPAGGKSWRLKYRIGGREGKLGLGRYPDVSLKEARRRRDEARQKLANGIDPSEEKKAAKTEAAQAAASSFGAVGAEYLEKIEKEGREAVTIKKSRWMLSLFGDAFNAKPLNGITPSELLAPLPDQSPRCCASAFHDGSAARARVLAMDARARSC
jgi:hypothetical protein